MKNYTVEKFAATRSLYTFTERNAAGELIQSEFTRCENDGSPRNNMQVWKNAGYISEALPSWWAVTVYATAEDGTCRGKYNPTVKPGGAGNVLAFDWMLEATEENLEKLLAEIERRAFEDTKRFRLFMSRLGNGVTVCNKAREEHGDYMHVAHIADCGKITWYINPDNIPAHDRAEIEFTALRENKAWEARLSAMGEYERFSCLLDMVPDLCARYALDMDASTAEKVDYLKGVLLTRSTLAGEVV